MPQVQKLNYDHDSCVRLNPNSLRISRVSHNFYRKKEVETVKKMAKSKTFLRFTQKALKKSASTQTSLNNHDSYTTYVT